MKQIAEAQQVIPPRRDVDLAFLIAADFIRASENVPA